MVELALEKGDKVCACLRRPAELDVLKDRYPNDALHIARLDVTHPDEIRQVFEEAKQKFGRVDVVFNNAGRFLVGEAEATPEAEAREVMDANFWGAANVSREAVRFFREENAAGAGGMLLNLSSESGINPQPCVAYYNATKHGMPPCISQVTLKSDLLSQL